MKLSEILKKIQQGELNISKEEIKPQDNLQKETEVKPPIELKELSVDKVYGDAISSVRWLFNELLSGKKKIGIDNILSVISDSVELFKTKTQELLLYSCYSTPDSYIYAHSVNVMIYSGIIAQAKNFNDSEFKELLLCSILHDIGMVRVLHIAEKSSKIQTEEYEEVKKHCEYVKEEIDKLNLPYELKQKLITIISEIHERIDGSGYLKKLNGEEINLYAKIISIADIYEALTHPRPYRDRILPHDAVLTLVKQAQTELDPHLVKLFVDKISIFPVGSYVKLNTGDIARVVATNPSFPLRPKVKILITAEKIVPSEVQILDLAKNSQISIVEAVDETKIETKDKKLLLQLKAQRWWVKGSGL